MKYIQNIIILTDGMAYMAGFYPYASSYTFLSTFFFLLELS